MSIPDPGQKWYDGSSGETFSVVAVTRQRVILSGDAGTYHEVPIHAWPQGLVLVPDASVEDGTPYRIEAMLVGGDEGRHFVRLRDIAAGLGVDITMHVHGRVRRPPGAIPRGVEMVIFLNSHIGHTIYNPVKDLCVSSGIPFVHVRSDGFQYELTRELSRVGAKLERSSFGGALAISAGWWSWDGDGWTYVDLPAEAGASWGDGLIAAILSFLPMFALR